MKRIYVSFICGGLISLLLIFAFPWPALSATKKVGKKIATTDQKETPILAEVNGWVVRKEDLQWRIDNFPPKERSQFKTDEQKNGLLATLVKNHLLALEARKSGLDKTGPLKVSIDDVVDFILANAYISEKLSNSQIPDQEIKVYYDSHRADFSVPAMVLAKHILIRVDLNAPLKDWQTALDKINKIRTELDEGGDFAMLAGKYSEDSTSSKRGGEIGFVKKNELHADVAHVTFSLPMGKYSEPVRSVFGYHIILVTERRDGRLMELSEATPPIREILFKEKRGEAIVKEVERLKNKYKVKVR